MVLALRGWRLQELVRDMGHKTIIAEEGNGNQLKCLYWMACCGKTKKYKASYQLEGIISFFIAFAVREWRSWGLTRDVDQETTLSRRDEVTNKKSYFAMIFHGKTKIYKTPYRRVCRLCYFVGDKELKGLRSGKGCSPWNNHSMMVHSDQIKCWFGTSCNRKQ